MTSARDGHDRGFTLVEVVIAIVLVGILSAVVVVGVGQLTTRGTTAACTTSADAARAAATTHLGTTGSYPTTFTAMTGATPPTLTLPDGATIDATGRIATVGSWTLVLAPGTGPQAPRFLCSTDAPTGFTMGPTGNYYRYIDGAFTQATAVSAAAAYTHNGRAGHLVTITSAEEQAFIESILPPGGQTWLGASDAAEEGIWRWVVGPEAGTQFSTGATSFAGAYRNWWTSQPTNTGGVEHCATTVTSWSNQWNDWICWGTTSYVVEIPS